MQQLQVQNGEQLSVSFCCCLLVDFEYPVFALLLFMPYALSMQGIQLSTNNIIDIIKAIIFMRSKNSKLYYKCNTDKYYKMKMWLHKIMPEKTFISK